jgi:phosphoribosylglycinamide formyltransferase 1
MSQHTPRLVVLLSGSGRTLVNLQEHIKQGSLDAQIVLVIASRQCRGIELAKTFGIPAEVVPGDLDQTWLKDKLESVRADWVLLAGYLRRCPIPEGFRQRILNIHPALLPKFGGNGMHGRRVHQAVLQSGDQLSGCTVHYCDEHYDSGPIIAQMMCPVLPDDTPETLAARVFELELELYPKALTDLLQTRPDPAR